MVTDEAVEDDQDQVCDPTDVLDQVQERTRIVQEPEAGPWLPGPRLVEDVEVVETDQTSSTLIMMYL